MTKLYSAPPLSTRPARLYAADSAKGIAILFVVFGHAWRGVYGAGLLQDAAVFHTFDRLIYAWHMPLFFFLSGLHFVSLAQKQSTGPFVLGRMVRLLWPLIIWTWIFFAFKLIAGGSANSPVALTDFPLIPLPPYEHLWFLWALFLIQMAFFPAILGLRRFIGGRFVRGGLGGLAVIFTVIMSLTYLPSDLFGLALVNAPFLLMGAALGQLSERNPPSWLAIAAGIVALCALYGVAQGTRGVPISMVMVLSLWLLILFFEGGRDEPVIGFGLLRYLGNASMAIFLAHTIFSAAFRIALLMAGITSLPVHLFVALGVGVLGPLGLLWLANRFGFRRFLGI